MSSIVRRLSGAMSAPQDESNASQRGRDRTAETKILGRVDAQVERRWLDPRRFDRGVGEEDWTVELVEKRLVAAIRLTERASGRVGPAAYGSGSPQYAYEALDLWYQQSQAAAELAAGHRQRNRVRLGATSLEVTNQEQALRWSIEHLANSPREREALNIFLFCKAKRLRWQAVVKERGQMSVSTAKRRKAAALARICAALIATKTPVPLRR